MTRPKTARTLPDPLLSIPELADHWGCSTDTVDQLIRTGRLAAVRVGSSRLVRVRLSDADAILRPVLAGGPTQERVS